MVVRCTGRLLVLWHRRMITIILLLALFCCSPWNTHCVASFSMNHQQHQYQHRHSNQHVRIRARGVGLRKDIILSLVAETAATATSMITDVVSSSSMDTNIMPVPSIAVTSIAAAQSSIASISAVVVATIGGDGSSDRNLVLQSVARGLGYLVGTGSVLLYTPIAVRIVRQQRAEGLTVSTWWCKLISYTCTIFYSYDKGFPLSTYAETIIIALEALTILLLVTYFQQPQPPKKTERITSSTGTPATVQNNEQENTTTLFLGTLGVFLTIVLVVLTGTVTVPSEVLAVGQGGSTLLNVGALVPQFKWNATTQTSGDYSPITALLASVGCTIRVFTTYQLTEADPVLLFSYGTAFLLNTALFVQILYYGVRFEQKSIRTVLTADYNTNTSTNTNTNASDKNEE